MWERGIIPDNVFYISCFVVGLLKVSLTLIWKGGWIILPSVQKHFIKNNCATYDIPNLPVSRYWTKFRRGYFRFPDFWSNSNKGKLSLDQKLNLARGARNVRKKLTKTSFCQTVTSLSFFLIYCQFGAIRKPDSGSMVFKTYIFINSNL